MTTPDHKRTWSNSNPLATHWRGEYGLLPTLLLTMLVLRIALGVLQNTVPPSLTSAWLVFILVVFLWQVVGAVRAVEKYLKDTGEMLAVIGGYFVILCVALLTVMQAVDALASKHTEAVLLPALPTLPVSADEKTLSVEGNLDWNLFAAFENTLAVNPDIKNIHLASTGGYVFVARAMSLKILELELNTHVESRCYSACTVVFLAGVQRTMADLAELGFHRYKLLGAGYGVDVLEELEKDREFFSRQGVSDDFINEVFEADHSQLWKPDKSRLSAAGVLIDR